MVVPFAVKKCCLEQQFSYVELLRMLRCAYRPLLWLLMLKCFDCVVCIVMFIVVCCGLGSIG